MFVAGAPAAGLSHYTIREVEKGTNPAHSLSTVSLLNGQSMESKVK